MALVFFLQLAASKYKTIKVKFVDILLEILQNSWADRGMICFEEKMFPGKKERDIYRKRIRDMKYMYSNLHKPEYHKHDNKLDLIHQDSETKILEMIEKDKIDISIKRLLNFLIHTCLEEQK